ncbi:hypothetical protein ASPZODRAFT_17603 [Penicilliopsis zonata CBS 506.65]|uniref:Phosphoglycerate mutase n=1 Tax=Penicilliopsis zonata CBS 506.65 TaxID=1073090 RepID=A0A1L9SDT6_9EURO|nr:hypothetical protein ASPZODRAFT_17603 [Penicilliopsis zonata CBS 506.65]OJJ45385.1 hypothetical protein ASPZODRAFT_17603 [Penicilliopsis zonata CBS 506.65]
MSSRVFLIANGETDWTDEGKHESVTERGLLPRGIERVGELREASVGVGKLIDPRKILKIYCSPRERARRTVEILHLGVHSSQTFHERESDTQTVTPSLFARELDGNMIEVTPALEEWKYGEYEGLTVRAVQEERHARGEEAWNIWRDGCPGGESPSDVTARLDKLIDEIKAHIDDTVVKWPTGQRGTHRRDQPRDVVCVAHGHVLASLALRWAGQPLENGMRLIVQPGGVVVLGYEHENLDEPAIILGRQAGN